MLSQDGDWTERLDAGLFPPRLYRLRQEESLPGLSRSGKLALLLCGQNAVASAPLSLGTVCLKRLSRNLFFRKEQQASGPWKSPME
jgi:hypothetical protein